MILFYSSDTHLPSPSYCTIYGLAFSHQKLKEYDSLLRSIIRSILNIHLDEDNSAWLLATLPVKRDIGIRCVTQLAPSAHLASAAASSDLVSIILLSHLANISNPHLITMVQVQYLLACSGSIGEHHQKAWDSIKVSPTFTKLLEDAPDEKSCARLLAASSPESGAWPNAPRCSSLSLHLDNDTIQVVADLYLGTSICKPHKCRHCDAELDSLGTHGLSCKWSEGHNFRHAAIFIMPYLLPRFHHGLNPPGHIVLMARDQNATCSDTFAPSYITSVSTEAGAVANLAKERKWRKYCDLATTHIFQPVAVETAGIFGPATFKFLKTLAK